MFLKVVLCSPTLHLFDQTYSKTNSIVKYFLQFKRTVSIWIYFDGKAEFFYCVGPTFASKTSLTHWGTDSTRPLKVCCGIWHQNVSSRSFKSCKLQGWIGLVCSAHPTDARLDWDLGNLEAKSKLCSSSHSWTIFALWQGALSCWKRPQPPGNTVSMKGCTWSATMLR